MRKLICQLCQVPKTLEDSFQWDWDFQHPVLSLLACVVYPPEKSTPNKCHCWGQTETDDPGDQA